MTINMETSSFTANQNDLALAQPPRENAGDSVNNQTKESVETRVKAAVASSALFGLESFPPAGLTEEELAHFMSKMTGVNRNWYSEEHPLGSKSSRETSSQPTISEEIKA